MTQLQRSTFVAAALWSAMALTTAAQQPAAVRIDQRTGQFFVDGKPFLMLAGELGNSSAGTAEQADTILPRLAHAHLNTVLMPVAWDQIEPMEGHFDFAILDHWVSVVRAQHLHLVLLWFGSWKNSTSGYAPAWVKEHPERFPRALTADGLPTETLSPLSKETERCDGRAFAALMAHLRDLDAAQHTVLMVQVENEVGLLGDARDRSPAANRAFAEPVPAKLLAYLADHRITLSPELSASFHADAKGWAGVFGDRSGEVFMAWQYAQFIESVASQGKAQYALPMYVNAQLPAPLERAGEYPSGAPHPYFLDVYRAAAPSLDLYSPDIYWPEFEFWSQRYAQQGRYPLFIPEARLDVGAYNALYAFGQAHAFGFGPFGIDSLPSDPGAGTPQIAEVYRNLETLTDLLTDPQIRTAALVLHRSSPRSSQTAALGGYLFHAALARSYPSNAIAEDDGAMLVLELEPNDFAVLGAGLTVTVSPDPDAGGTTGGILSLEEVTRTSRQFQVVERLNGDQSNQNRDLMMDPRHFKLFRLKLYTSAAGR